MGLDLLFTYFRKDLNAGTLRILTVWQFTVKQWNCRVMNQWKVRINTPSKMINEWQMGLSQDTWFQQLGKKCKIKWQFLKQKGQKKQTHSKTTSVLILWKRWSLEICFPLMAGIYLVKLLRKAGLYFLKYKRLTRLLIIYCYPFCSN